MGVIYSVQCDRCNTHFDHQSGIGFMCDCRDCGEHSDELAPFFCPVCNKRFEPDSESFSDNLRSITHWD